MSWSDAARAAALQARRAHMYVVAGKRVKQMSFYHGTNAKVLKGGVVRPPSKYKGAFATTDLKMARGYGATVYKTAQPHNLASQTVLARLRSKAENLNDKIRIDRTHSYIQNNLGHGKMVISSRAPLRAHRLPRAKGRASRGKY